MRGAWKMVALTVGWLWTLADGTPWLMVWASICLGAGVALTFVMWTEDHA